MQNKFGIFLLTDVDLFGLITISGYELTIYLTSFHPVV